MKDLLWGAGILIFGLDVLLLFVGAPTGLGLLGLLLMFIAGLMPGRVFEDPDVTTKRAEFFAAKRAREEDR